MKIIQVINNNNVCVLNERGKEQIVSGKGIGFAKKPGDIVSPEQIQKTYLITDSAMQKKLIELLTEIPEAHIRLTNDLVEQIRSEIPEQLSESLLITLSDHISFAIKRKEDGIEFTNPMMDSLRSCYPEELRLGYYCLEQIEKILKIKFIPDEAGFIAMHIINARYDMHMNEIYNITKVINGCSEIALHTFPMISNRCVSYERFMIHIKYLAHRIGEGKPLSNILTKDKLFVEQIRKAFPDEYSCAEEMAQYILETKSVQLTEEEMVTLTFHLAKMTEECR